MKNQTEENKEKERLLQEKFMEYQIMQQQLGQVQKQLQQLSSQREEITSIQQSLTDLGNVEKGAEILVPICSGIFTKAALAGSNELIVNVGNNVAVNKSISNVKEMLSKQASEIIKVEAQIKGQMEKFSLRASEIEEELQGLIKEAKDNV